jgi:hypothetical protein
LIIRKRLLQLWACSIDTLRRLSGNAVALAPDAPLSTSSLGWRGMKIWDLLDMRDVEAAAGTPGLTVVTVEIRRIEDNALKPRATKGNLVTG